MFVITAKGVLVYAGAIDSARSWDSAKVTGAENYVAGVLDDLLKDVDVKPSSTKPYGCSVKY